MMNFPGLVMIAAVAIVSGTTLVAFVAFLLFCRFVVRKTGSTSGLRDLAVALRAFGEAFRRGSILRLPRHARAPGQAKKTEDQLLGAERDGG
jgi:hypothetical protein